MVFSPDSTIAADTALLTSRAPPLPSLTLTCPNPHQTVTERKRTTVRSVLLMGLLMTATHTPLDAQVRRGRAPDPTAGWAPIALGVSFGWDQAANGQVVGGQVRLPLLRDGTVEVVPNAQLVFLRGNKEYQYSLEAVFVPEGVRGGLLLGGGLSWRDAVLSRTGPNDTGDPRQRHSGYNIVVGAKNNVGVVQIEVSLRWIFLNDTNYRPTPATFGVNYPLWRTAPPRP
jgi:hypothetical protein